MATTIVSNLVVFSDASGHGNQSHLVYAVNQQRWWLFVIKTKTATVVSSYVSSSNDLTTATWSASTDSPALGISLTTADQRNLGVIGFANGSTDVAHVNVSTTVASSSGRVNHIRATFTGASSITWETWNTVSFTSPGTPKAVHGDTLGLASGGKVHGCTAAGVLGNGVDGDPNGRISTNADTTATWTNGFATQTDVDDSMASGCESFAFAQLASDSMLLAFSNSSVSDTQSSGLRYNVYTTPPTNTGNADVGIGATTQDQNDWCLCRVDATHQYAFRPSSTTAMVCRKFDGVSTWSTPASTVPAFTGHAFKAGAGVFVATDGTDLYLFVLDNTGNNAIYYVKGSTANGTISFGAWTQLEAVGSTARNFISGCLAVSNSQIGVIFTAVNGSHFDINVSVLSLGGAVVILPRNIIRPCYEELYNIDDL